MRKNTFVEKILNAESGSIVYVEPDIVLSHDNSARVRKLFEKMDGKDVLKPEQLVVVLDRKMTGTTDELIHDYNSIHAFMEEQKVERFFDCDQGICHQVLAGYLKEGMIVVGSDSHTCTAGALNCFAVGLNKTETAYLWKNGKIWLRVPETIRIRLSGELREGVYAKDLALWIMGMLREEFVEYKAIEYHGEGVRTLSVADRMTIANVSAEMGVTNSVFPPDDVLADYFGDYAVPGIWADEHAHYYKEFELRLEEVFPLVMAVHEHREMKSVDDCCTMEVQQGLIGACSNGRIEDLRVVARILKNKTLAPGFQLLVVPASREIYIRAVEEGLTDIMSKAGASILGASCGPCLGSSHIIQANTKRFLTTTNSNSMRRLEEIGVEQYVASPATVATTALEGKICGEYAYPGEVYPYWGNPVEPVRIDPFDKRKTGNVWNYSDVNYISGKQIFADKLTYKISKEDTKNIVRHLMAGLDENFAAQVRTGDIILAGESFGCGRLIKHAAIGLVGAGIKAVIVKSANRNFFRMAVNHGLTVIIAPEVVEAYRNGDKVEPDFENNRILLNEREFILPEVSSVFREMLRKGGIFNLAR